MTRYNHDPFGAFRALLHQRSLTKTERIHLFSLMNAAATNHPTLYRDQWLPYFHSFPRHLDQPLCVFFSYEALELACHTHPGCPFALEVSRQPGPQRILHLASKCRLIHLSLSASYLPAPPSTRVNDSILTTLANSEHLAHLKRLDLDFSDLGPRGISALSQSPHLRQLTHLKLRYCGIGSDELRILAESPNISDLTHLDLSANPLDNQSCHILSTSPSFSNLTHLALGSIDAIDDDGIIDITLSPHLNNLESLDLSSDRVGDIAAWAIAESSNHTHLKMLNLWNTRLGNEGARALAEATYLGDLEELEIGNTDVTLPGILALVQAAGLPALGILRATHLRCGGAAEVMVAEDVTDTPATLDELDLECSDIGDAGATLLAHSPQLANLSDLNLNENSISDLGATALANSPHLTRLRWLLLENVDGNYVNTIGPHGAAAIAASPFLSLLDVLTLDDAMIGAAGADAIADSPNLSDKVRGHWASRRDSMTLQRSSLDEPDTSA